ncbi:YgiQ family radical SAM protein [Thiosocius teredinicola]|uniref:YgiQ family radical SAM protein n=1 Tax=Thiosocius teredinicola TaxID=1973002 RepID=UPI00099147B6
MIYLRFDLTASRHDHVNPPAPNLFDYRRHWAHKFGPAPFLPMTRDEMDVLGWDSCDVILVTGDAYVDHPSFGMAVIGRVLEAQGFRVGIIAQPDWQNADDFAGLGPPNLYFGVTGGNMDSMVNRYTSERRLRSDDAYTPDGVGGQRPDRAVIVYSQRCREAFKGVPVVIGGIEASLRRIAHFDYWQEKVRRSVLVDAKADMLLFGNAERAIVELTHRLAAGEAIGDITDIRGTAFVRHALPSDWTVIDSTQVDEPGRVEPHPDPYLDTTKASTEAPPAAPPDAPQVVTLHRRPKNLDRGKTAVRIPAFETVRSDPILYAHASRVLHLESNPGNARALIQQHGDREVWINPPPLPLRTPELDRVFELPYQRVPHPTYGEARIPAYEMIRFSVNIMRGCFGGCSFCSITEHEGRIIQNRSEQSILREIENIRDHTPGFTGVISDLGGPTANMWRLHCKDPKIESSCRRLSCVYPGICDNLNTDQMPLVRLYRKARALPGVKRVFIASGLRYDIAVETPEYVKELVTHHVGGYLKIAPEHTEDGPLSKMMKPGMGTYDRFKAMFDKYSKQAGKEQYLIPYFIAAHPGTTDEDMLNLALWLKRNGFRADQVQAFLPSPMALATAMWHSGRNPLKKVTRSSEQVSIPKGAKQRRLHKAFLRYHDANNWPLLREALKDMGRADLIGNGKRHLVPSYQPAGTGKRPEGSRTPGKHRGGKPSTFRTQHTHGVQTKSRSGKRKTRR